MSFGAEILQQSVPPWSIVRCCSGVAAAGALAIGDVWRGKLGQDSVSWFG